LAGCHFDGAELRDLSRVSRGAPSADLGVAQGGSGNRAVDCELGNVLCGIGTRRQEGRGLPQATLFRAKGGPTGSRPNVKCEPALLRAFRRKRTLTRLRIRLPGSAMLRQHRRPPRSRPPSSAGWFHIRLAGASSRWCPSATAMGGLDDRLVRVVSDDVNDVARYAAGRRGVLCLYMVFSFWQSAASVSRGCDASGCSGDGRGASSVGAQRRVDHQELADVLHRQHADQLAVAQHWQGRTARGLQALNGALEHLRGSRAVEA